MNRKQINRHLLKLKTYDFSQFSIASFIAWLENEIGRKIILIPWTMPAGKFGAWISDADDPVEYIFFDKEAPPLQKIHTQLHECCHILCQHPTLAITKENLRKLFGASDDIAYRSSPLFDQPKRPELEVEAEFVAAIVQKQALQHNRQKQLVQEMMVESVNLGQYLKSIGVLENE